MAIVTTREELKQYCLRALGHPVIKINVADQQLEDRLDDSLAFMADWTINHSFLNYRVHELKPSIMNLSSPIDPNDFSTGKQIVGTTSEAKATLHKAYPTYLEYYGATKDFILGEAITVGTSSASIGSNPTDIVKKEFENRYLDIPNEVLSVLGIMALNTTNAGNFLFQGQYHVLNDVLMNWNRGGESHTLSTYEMYKQYINMVHFMFVGEKPVRYNRLMEKLYIDLDWLQAVRPGQYIVIRTYELVDPNQYMYVWNDQGLKDLTIAYFKMQWAQNLSKFGNVQLLNGITIGANDFYNIASTEKKEAEEKVKRERSKPLGFIVG